MNERQIISRCKDNDLDGYRLLYDRYARSLLHTAFRMLGQLQEAEDAVQMTFTKLFKGIQNYRLDSKFSTYLFRILLNTCFDLLKKRKYVTLNPLGDSEPGGRSRSEQRFELEQAIDRLPHQMKACFVLFAVENMKQDEIAEVLNLSVGGVKSNIHHAKIKLRALLAPEYGEVKS